MASWRPGGVLPYSVASWPPPGLLASFLWPAHAIARPGLAWRPVALPGGVLRPGLLWPPGVLCWCCIASPPPMASQWHAGHHSGVLCDLPRPGTTTRHNDQTTLAIDIATRPSLPRHNTNDEKIAVFCRFSNHYMRTIVMISTPLNPPKEIYYSPKRGGGL